MNLYKKINSFRGITLKNQPKIDKVVTYAFSCIVLFDAMQQ